VYKRQNQLNKSLLSVRLPKGLPPRALRRLLQRKPQQKKQPLQSVRLLKKPVLLLPTCLLWCARSLFSTHVCQIDSGTWRVTLTQ
jgi:hypothetical protein